MVPDLLVGPEGRNRETRTPVGRRCRTRFLRSGLGITPREDLPNPVSCGLDTVVAAVMFGRQRHGRRAVEYAFGQDSQRRISPEDAPREARPGTVELGQPIDIVNGVPRLDVRKDDASGSQVGVERDFTGYLWRDVDDPVVGDRQAPTIGLERCRLQNLDFLQTCRIRDVDAAAVARCLRIVRFAFGFEDPDPKPSVLGERVGLPVDQPSVAGVLGVSRRHGTQCDEG